MSRHVFTCHKSSEETPVVCAGFLMNGAAHNLSIRLMAMQGKIDWDAVTAGGFVLHEDYREMAIANGVDPDDPVLRACRSNQG